MSLKQTTARTIKWNTINSVATQVLYAVTGVILANILSKEDYGLVGALLIFQAFAMVLVDSGFGAALLQRKHPTETDYSTVFWFNLGVSGTLYLLLFAGAPVIADIFQGDRRLIPLSKVMFLTLIVNALGIIQTNRLMKRMDVRQIAISNTVGLILSGATGIWLAVSGAGAWALVWQTLVLSAVKSAWLWMAERWRPRAVFSLDSLRGIVRLGASVAGTSLLNTLFLQAYSFVTGAFYSMADLGIYTQGDKWSKMGSASISQIITASFIPLLAGAQDNRVEFHNYVRRINRFTAFILFPALLGMAAIASPLFHTLFGNKWDAAIPLFAILSVRGIFVVLLSLCTNYLLSLGYGKRLVWVEVIKDGAIAVAILCTVWTKSLEALVWGQMAASALTLLIVAPMTGKAIGYSPLRAFADMLPFMLSATAACLSGWGASILLPPLAPCRLLLTVAVAAALYILTLRMTRNPELSDALATLHRHK
ncbi:MAG: lipopolysaccharide biosynthesis protein [Muribaculaceae bacterium]|nr:lipopolysaccharide biosynthesis protein [Muribaculaceae bacterium]